MGTVSVPVGFLCHLTNHRFPTRKPLTSSHCNRLLKSPVDQPLELNSNLATKLALRRQKKLIDVAKQEGGRIPGHQSSTTQVIENQKEAFQ